MLAHHFKNFLTLLYKLTDIITIYCKNENELILHSLDEKTFTLLYHFEFKSPNLLRSGYTYIINLADIHKLFKYIKGSSLLCFSIREPHLVIEIVENNIKQELLFPIIYGQNVEFKYYNDFINGSSTVNIKLSDLSRMIKSLKNTSDVYSLSFTNTLFNIKNISAVIPISYTIPLESYCEGSPASGMSEIIINNYSLLRLTKLYSDNSYVDIGRNFISCEIVGSPASGVKYYIAFLPPHLTELYSE